jgi:glycogen(starch) synthase
MQNTTQNFQPEVLGQTPTISQEQMDNTLLFEIAWEVVNQVGGIYTVIRSKVPSVISKWSHDNYFLIGPYFQQQAAAYFDPIKDLSDPVGQVVQQLRERGFEVHYGNWLVSGNPRVILFNPFTAFHLLGRFKYEFWEHHHISTPGDDPLLNQVMSFGYQVTEFFRLMCAPGFTELEIIAHFHEWMAGVPIPEMRRENMKAKIVFTTHATLLGRYLAMNDTMFYDHLPNFDWAKEAKYFNIESMVQIERAAAHGSHVFSTVSEITAKECLQLLGRQPDIILPNGLNIERFEALHKVQILHKENREKIHEFVMGHFFQSYSFDLNNTLYFFTSGRFEYHNKGYDLTVEALARLNWKMQQAGIDKTVVAFFITRQPYHSFNPEVLQSKAQMEDIRRVCEEIQEQVGQRLYYAITSSNGEYHFPNLNEMVDDYNKLRLRRNVQSWKTFRLPTVVTHNLVDDSKDELLNFIRTVNLVNNQHDKVKIVYHPDFVSAANPLFKMDYQNFVRGCHLGIFPSYYEPWGYTPLESQASGVPSITSDLAGFGDYVINNIPNHDELGLFIVHRNHTNFWDSAEEMANKMFDFVQLNRRERIAQRNRCEESSLHFDWRNLGKYYDQAYFLALNE